MALEMAEKHDYEYLSELVTNSMGYLLILENKYKAALSVFKPISDKVNSHSMKSTILENIALPNLHQFATRFSINKHKELEQCEKIATYLTIKTPSLHAVVNSLSGGNQQKVVIAKWLMSEPRVLILDEPTRGIDVGAKYEIYKLMNSLAEQGVAIIMVSSELPEILGMSDRIMVMHEGQCTGILDRAEATQEKIMALATGLTGN